VALRKLGLPTDAFSPDRLGGQANDINIIFIYSVIIFEPKLFGSRPLAMHYVYIIASLAQPERHYVGLTESVSSVWIIITTG
jgi:hypothetical protein